MSGYVRGTCHTSKASFLLQLYLLNLIPGVGGGGGGEVRSKAVINFHQVSRYRSCIRERGGGGGEERARGEGFRTSIRRRRVSCTITNFESKVPWAGKKRKEGGAGKKRGKRKREKKIKKKLYGSVVMN